MESGQSLESCLDLLGFMLSSAKNLVIEPKMYGPFRLLDAASRLIDILEEQGIADDHVTALKNDIDEKKLLVMTDEVAFVSFLNEVVVTLAKLTRDREIP